MNGGHNKADKLQHTYEWWSYLQQYRVQTAFDDGWDAVRWEHPPEGKMYKMSQDDT